MFSCCWLLLFRPHQFFPVTIWCSPELDLGPFTVPCRLNFVVSAGTKCIPWLGDLSQLGPLNEAPSPSSYGSFPVKPNEKRSYAQSCVVWVQQSGLQTDIQKILRHARKMPEKTQHFYKVSHSAAHHSKNVISCKDYQITSGPNSDKLSSFNFGCRI